MCGTMGHLDLGLFKAIAAGYLTGGYLTGGEIFRRQEVHLKDHGD